MSQITIQCRLVAKESTRQQLWQLMADKNTPLINELLVKVAKHPEFEAWRKKGKIPAGTVKELCQALKADPRFIGQPARFYTSATALVSYIYKSWLKLIQRYQYQLEGKVRWQQMLRSDEELVEASGVTLENLRVKAGEILTQFASPQQSSTSETLFQTYRDTEDVLTRCAISYLLKNGCRVSKKSENPEKFVQRRRKLEIQIERLQEKLEARFPKGRDLNDSNWLETLRIAKNQVPESQTQAKFWQDNLLRKSASVPFPVAYESNGDMTWFLNEKGRICVKFNGLGEHTFEIYCDSRHLHWFQRFLVDYVIKKVIKNKYSSSLFTLRSGRISWEKGESKGEPWNIHRLILYCCVDTRLWTAEGTRLVAEEKAEEIAKNIAKTKEKNDLNDKQLAHIKRKQSTLARINNPFPRPNKPLYKGQSHILVGVSLGLENPATVAVVDVTISKACAYRTTRQLLGDKYKLLNRQRQQKHVFAHQRKIAQTLSQPNQFGDSQLGEYIDRLLAKEIIAIAQKYSAGSIVLPKLGDMREQVNSEIQAKAEQKCPECLEAQKKYAKQYRHSVHQWSYGRLIENIKSQAAKAGIAIEESKQPIRGSPQEKAKGLAITAYFSRK